MGKAITPSGYYIISIDSSHVDDDGYLLEETEDEKVLYELCRTGKILNKPLLLSIKNNTLIISSFAQVMKYNDDALITLNLIGYDSSVVLSTGYTYFIEFVSASDKIVITVGEY